MSTDIKGSTSWKKAMYLNELKRPIIQESYKIVQHDYDRVAKWRHYSFLKDQKLFENRLHAEELTLEQFEKMLNGEIEGNTDIPEWLQSFRTIMSRPIKVGNLRVDGLHEAFLPFLSFAKSEIDATLPKGHPFYNHCTEQFMPSLLENLSNQFLQLAARTLTLELNVSRLREELVGDSPEERFESFVAIKLRDLDGLNAFYEEYIVLARLLATRTLYFINNIVRFIERYVSDVKTLQNIFGLEQLTLLEMELGLGDSHEHGQSVIEISFLETTTRLIYKPKSLQVSLQVHELLNWFNQKDFKHPFATYRIIDCNEYCWEEKVLGLACEDTEELRRHHYRLGGLLGVMYLLKGTDLHFENIIASGEHPLIIDYETLFQNHLADVFEDSAEVQAKFKMVDSVLGTGLLPTLGFKSHDGKGIEMSGIGGSVQELPFPVLQSERENTDEMRFVTKPYWTEEKANRPSLKGSNIQTSDYVEEIVEGFTNVYSIAMQHNDELRENIDKFSKLKIRHILRSTNFYANFLTDTNHPNFLREAYSREMILDRMYFSHYPSMIVAAEKRELINGDVPYFYTTPSSLSLFDSAGHEYPNVFEETGIEKVYRKLHCLDDKTLIEQQQLIRSSIVASAGLLDSSYLSVDAVPIEPLTSKDYLSAAVTIGDELLESGIWNKDMTELTWLGIETNYNGQAGVSVIGEDFYNGTSGVAVFLTHLHRLTQVKRFEQAATAAIASAIRSAKPYNAFLSAYHGPISLINALTLIDQANESYQYKDKVEIFIDYLKGKEQQSTNCDLLGGCAGIIHALLNAYEYYGEKKYLKVATSYAKKIQQEAVDTGNGYAWPTQHEGNVIYLGGLGHGVSGILSALLRLNKYVPDNEQVSMALSALSYENSLYDAERRNWKDLRKAEESYSSYWCSGSTGIGFSKLSLMDLNCNAELIQDIDIIVASIKDSYLSEDHCLCHGDMGIVDFLITAAIKTGKHEWTALAHELATKVYQDRIKYGEYVSGIANGIDTPGLFLGKSGIGLQFLRLVNPIEVPSMLTLS